MRIRFSSDRHRPAALHWLLAGLLLGYGGLVLWQGLRLIVLVTGGAITGLAIATWCFFPRPQDRGPALSSANLLEREVWLRQLEDLAPLLPAAAQPEWQTAVHQATSIHPIVAQMAQQEPTFIPDLLEALHAVLHLVDQLGQALQTTQQVQTPYYQALAQQQVQRSQTRLQQTYEQLQELHDQLMLTHLTQRSRETVAGLSTRLQFITAENAQSLLESPK